MKKVEVIWVDATRECDPWVSQSRARELELETVVSIGYVVKKTKKLLVLCGDTTGHQLGRVHAVPIPCIKSIKRLS